MTGSMAFMFGTYPPFLLEGRCIDYRIVVDVGCERVGFETSSCAADVLGTFMGELETTFPRELEEIE